MSNKSVVHAWRFIATVGGWGLRAMGKALSKDAHQGEGLKTYPKDEQAGTKTRPDADNTTAVVAIKPTLDTPGPDGGPRKIYNSPQMDGQRESANKSKRNHVVVIVNGDRDNLRPSGPLGQAPPKGSNVLHYDPTSGAWSEWQPAQGDQPGKWVTKEDTGARAKELTGGR